MLTCRTGPHPELRVVVRTLHTLTLNLSHNRLGDSGAQALAGLKDATALHTLTLDLGSNNMGAVQ